MKAKLSDLEMEQKANRVGNQCRVRKQSDKKRFKILHEGMRTLKHKIAI